MGCTMRLPSLLGVGCICLHNSVWAFSDPLPPTFGIPVVCGDHLAFSGPGLDSRRLICISRDTGEKAWEIENPRRALKPWFPMEKELIVTVGSDIYSCDVATGELTFLCRSGYDRCRLIRHEGSSAFVLGERRGVDYLSLMDVVSGKQMWAHRNIYDVVAEGDDVVLGEGYQRGVWESGGMRQEGQRLVAFSVKSGKRPWLKTGLTTPFDIKGVHIDGSFVLAVDNTVLCLSQDDGRELNCAQLDEDPTVNVRLAAWGDEVVAWTTKGWRPMAGHVVVSLSVPELEEKLRLEAEHGAALCYTYEDVVIGDCWSYVSAYNLRTKEKLWEGAGWGWDGVHDGYMYFTTTEVGLTHTSVNRIEVRTGRRERLYEEEISEELR